MKYVFQTERYNSTVHPYMIWEKLYQWIPEGQVDEISNPYNNWVFFSLQMQYFCMKFT